MHVKASDNVVEDTSDVPFTGHEDGLAVVRVAVDSLHCRRTDKERIVTIFDLVLVVAASGLYMGEVPQPRNLPRSPEARQTPFTSEQFLHGALFDLALLGEELLQGLDES